MTVDKVRGGVKNISKTGQTFSKKPLSKVKTEKQLKAIEWSKNKGK